MIKVVDMLEEHLDEVVKIEKECFSIPWSKNSFLRELKQNKFAFYFVAIDTKENNKILGYGGFWYIINEAHITNIAVSSLYRNKGIASMILEKIIEDAKMKNMIGLTLEVRKSNIIAQKLYIRYGFKLEGIRKEYYEDNMEDAFIMWKYLDYS